MILPSPFQLRVFPDSMIDFFIFSSLKGEEISTKTQFIYLFPVGGEKKSGGLADLLMRRKGTRFVVKIEGITGQVRSFNHHIPRL